VAQIGTPVEIDNVVEIAGSRSLPERAKLLREDLDECVALHRAVVREHVFVGMGNPPAQRGLDDRLVVGEVELNPGLA
jgi:hypothetical protein